LPSKWLTSRSTYETGLDCQLMRYWSYHSGPLGMGISPSGLALDPWIGTQVHKCFEGILRLHISIQELQPRLFYRTIINSVLEDAKAELASEQIEDFTKLESLTLIEALVWGWVRSMLPTFLKKYQVVKVEQDFPYDVADSNIRLQTRADMILRNLQEGQYEGQLGIADWKTKGSGDISEPYIKEFQESPQMSAGILAAQEHLGEEVTHFHIQVLLKGFRGKFSKGKGQWKQETPQKRNHSPLLYAKFSPASPPLHDTQFDLGGYWFDKQPVWEQNFSQSGEGESTVETYIHLLPLDVLWQQFVEIGPYPRNDFAAHLFLKSLKVSEEFWQKIANEGSVDVSERLTRNFSLCNNYYGKQCAYYDLCYRVGDKHKEPLNGGFAHREPHHPEEAEMAAQKWLDSKEGE
jgi:hypothetical protein